MHAPGFQPGNGRRTDLRTVVFRAFAGATAAALVLVGVAKGIYFHRQHERDHAEQRHATVAAAAQLLQARLDDARRELTLVARLIDDRGERRAADLENVLRRLHDNGSRWRTLTVADRNGDALAGSPIVPDNTTGTATPPRSMRDGDTFRRVAATGAPHISTVVAPGGPDRAAAVVIGVPLRGPDGTFDGVLAGSLDLGDFSVPGRSEADAGTTGIVILDAAGAVVFSDTAGRFPPPDPAAGLTLPEPAARAAGSGKPVLRPTASGEKPAFQAEYRPVRVNPAGSEPSWWVAIVGHPSDLRHHLWAQLGWLGLAMAAALVGVAVTARSVAGRITRGVGWIAAHVRRDASPATSPGTGGPVDEPIREIEELQRELAETERGRTEATEALRASLRDKEELAAAISESREGLKRMLQTLEERVADRTTQLETAVALLESEVEQRKRSERLLAMENAALGQIVLGRPLAETLATIVAGVEREAEGIIVSILRLDDDDPRRLRVGASLKLPEEFIGVTDGIAIGPEVGTCGRAAALRETVVTEDIAADPHWRPFAAAAARCGLQACWSTPIFGAGGELLGTFAIYHRDKSVPPPREQQIVEQATNTAAVAIAVHRAELSRRRLEEQLRKAHKLEAVGTLASGIAHGFNNLLVPILGYADLLRSSPLAASPEVRQQIEQIIGASRQARALIQELLAFSRNAPPARSHLAPAAILREVATMLRSVARPGVEVAVEIEDERCRLCADPAQLHHLLMNLGNNALQALEPKGGRVRLGLRSLGADEAPPGVKLKRPGPHVCLTVADNGPGMTAEVRARIFEPFFTTKPTGRGTGLGLAVSHGIADVHGGVIAVDTAPGAGCTLRIYLPAIPCGTGEAGPDLPMSPAARPTPSPTAAATRGRALDLLLVEDEPAVATVLEVILRRAGHRVTVLDGGAAALARLSAPASRCDLLVSDVTMPGMSGVELARRAVQLRPDLPVLLMTGHGGIAPADLAAIGARCRVLAKPLESEALLAAVTALGGADRPA